MVLLQTQAKQKSKLMVNWFGLFWSRSLHKFWSLTDFLNWLVPLRFWKEERILGLIIETQQKKSLKAFGFHIVEKIRKGLQVFGLHTDRKTNSVLLQTQAKQKKKEEGDRNQIGGMFLLSQVHLLHSRTLFFSLVRLPAITGSDVAASFTITEASSHTN